MVFIRVFSLVVLSYSILFSDGLKSVSLQLQWKYQFQFAGYIMAKEKGFYKNTGLDVTIKEWAPGIKMVDQVIEKKSEYAVVRPTSMIDISNGKEIVYLATIFQTSPLVLLADERSNIRTIKDFKNKKIMTTGDLNTDSSLLSMMFSQGLKIEDMQELPPSFNVRDLLNGKTDLMAAYISNEPYVLESLGGKPVIFSPKDYGFDFYNDIVATSKEYLKAHPKEVTKFKNATLKGWEYAFQHIEETASVIYNKYNSQNKTKDALVYEGKMLKKFAYYKTDTLGEIKKEKLQKIYDVYKLLGLSKNYIDLKDIIFDEHTFKQELTKEEKKYLIDRKEITMCIDPHWMPFEHFDKNGKYEGMTADYFQIFAKILSTEFKVVQSENWTQSIEFAKERKCDIFSLAMETPKRKEYMNFTSPYLVIPLVVATNLEVPFVSDVKDLKGKKIGISTGYAFIEILKTKYPYLEIVEVENIDDGLQRVSNGELFGYIGTLASIGYKLQTKYIGELKVTGKIDEYWKLGIGVRNDDPVLLNILQKAVNSLSSEQNREIFNKWVSINYAKEIDYTLIWELVTFFSFVFLIGTYAYRKEQRLKRRLGETNTKLESAYQELQKVAITDKLTSLYNRHKLDEALAVEKSRADRYGGTFSVILLDIDRFKVINDTFGHHIGDKVLQELSMILKENSRKTDIVGRWGGEEFLVITPNLGKDYIENFARNIQTKVEQHFFHIQHKVTVSIGVSVYLSGEDTQKTVTRADFALYEAKHSGRNNVKLK